MRCVPLLCGSLLNTLQYYVFYYCNIGLHYNIPSTGSAAPELVNLIVFNPLSDARIAHASLSSGTQRWRAQLCKHRSSFAEDSYQLVCVSPGIMGGAERLRAQCLVGVSEHAPVV